LAGEGRGLPAGLGAWRPEPGPRRSAQLRVVPLGVAGRRREGVTRCRDLPSAGASRYSGVRMVGLRERFASLLTSQPIDLGRAALEIARIGQSDLDPEPSLRGLDDLAAALAPRLPADPPPDDAARLLAHYLFDECGYRGNRDDYYDPRNSFLNEVLVRRSGIPISLSVLAIEVGRRLGIPVQGVGFPGHF